MRIAISAVMGMSLALVATNARAQGTPGEPAAGQAALAQPPAPPPPSVEPDEPGAHHDIAGWHDGFYLRDRRDIFRFYPHILAETDFYSSFGPGVRPDTSKSTDQAPDVAQGLKPRLSVRRARIGFDAELLKRWSVTALLEFGSQPVGNTAGTTETYAAKPGTTPTGSTGRYAAVQSVATAPYPADVFINYSVCKCFNLQVGQFNIPFSLDNRTGDDYYPMLERPAAIRSFIMPGTARDIGVMAWGELGPRVFNYEIGIFGGDGQNRPFVGGSVDGIGRIFARPFAGSGSSDLEKYTQIGVSARHGFRDQKSVAYDQPAITTGQGFVLWKPTYTDSMMRQVHVIPSGAQNWIGGEYRMQVSRFALQGEAYYLVNNTREAIDGTQLTNTERLGRVKGVGWYVQVSAWPFGDAFLSPEPGIYRPRHLDLDGRPKTRMPHGLEMIAQVSGINASYDGATRLGSTPDPKTPNGDITVYQAGVGANYWHTKHARFGVYYMAFVTPDSGTSANQAVVPDNLTKSNATMKPNTGHVLHELSARLAVTF